MSARTVILPKLGLTMDEGTIAAWHKREGEPVTTGEALLAVETDKVTMDVEAPAGGYLRRILVANGETVPVTTVIAVIADTLDEPIDAAMAVIAPRGVAAEAAAPAGASASEPQVVRDPTGDRVAASPAARKRAADLGIDITSVRGSGPGGRVRIEDVERVAAARSAPEG